MSMYLGFLAAPSGSAARTFTETAKQQQTKTKQMARRQPMRFKCIFDPEIQQLDRCSKHISCAMRRLPAPLDKKAVVGERNPDIRSATRVKAPSKFVCNDHNGLL